MNYICADKSTVFFSENFKNKLKMEVNLISDTITKPTPKMLVAMFEAVVGDDVYKQDPTVIALEARLASIEARAFSQSPCEA